MSAGFAAKVKHSTASLAVHKAQLRSTETLLANIDVKLRHVFRLMDLPEELRRIILAMVAQEWTYGIGGPYFASQCLPSTAFAGNEQLRQETILASLQHRAVSAYWDPESTEEWLSKLEFGVLQEAGTTSIRDGFSAVLAANIERNDRHCRDDWWKVTARLLQRFENLRDLNVSCSNAIKMFEIGLDHGISDDALGAKVRECNLDLTLLETPSLKRLMVTMGFRREFHAEWLWYGQAADVPEWRRVIEHGCQRVAKWLSEEYSARGLVVTVDILTDLEIGW